MILELATTYYLEVGFGLVTTSFGWIISKLNKKINEQEHVKLGVQALLRDRIIQSYNHYLDKGFCPIYARDNINSMAEQYYNLGGNGVVHDLLEKLMDLPTEKEGVHDE